MLSMLLGGYEGPVDECSQVSLRRPILDRDVDAARKVMERGLERARVEERPLVVHRRISKFALLKQEASGGISHRLDLQIYSL